MIQPMGKLERFVTAMERIADSLDEIRAHMIREEEPKGYGPVKQMDESYADFDRRLYRWRLRMNEHDKRIHP